MENTTNNSESNENKEGAANLNAASSSLKEKKEIIKSRKVYIRLKDNIAVPGADEFMNISRRLSAVFSPNGTVLNPLTWEECEKFLPQIINVEKQDLAFRKEVENYFTNISVSINLNEKYELEVGMKYDSEEDFLNEKVSYDEKTGKMTGVLLGTPLKVADYILYRFALQHSKVANKKDFLYASRNLWFYIEDLAAEKELAEKYITTKMAATKEFLINCTERTKQIAIINSSLSEVPIEGLAENFEPNELMITLDKIISKNPERFLKLSKDPNLALRGLVTLALHKGILTRVANTETIMYTTDSGAEVLGNSVEQVIGNLKNERFTVIRNQIEIRIKGLR